MERDRARIYRPLLTVTVTAATADIAALVLGTVLMCSLQAGTVEATKAQKTRISRSLLRGSDSVYQEKKTHSVGLKHCKPCALFVGSGRLLLSGQESVDLY